MSYYRPEFDDEHIDNEPIDPREGMGAVVWMFACVAIVIMAIVITMKAGH